MSRPDDCSLRPRLADPTLTLPQTLWTVASGALAPVGLDATGAERRHRTVAAHGATGAP